MSKRQYTNLLNELERGGVAIDAHEYHERHFGSWYIYCATKPLLNLIWDGRNRELTIDWLEGERYGRGGHDSGGRRHSLDSTKDVRPIGRAIAAQILALVQSGWLVPAVDRTVTPQDIEARKQALIDLMQFKLPIDDTLQALQRFPWNPKSPRMRFQTRDLVAVLKRQETGELTAEQTRAWAGAMGNRDEIKCDPKALWMALHELRHPDAENPLTVAGLVSLLEESQRHNTRRSAWPVRFVGFQLALFALLILDRNLDDEHNVMTLTSHAGLLVLFVFVFSAFAGGLIALHQKRLFFLALQIVLIALFVLSFVATANQTVY